MALETVTSFAVALHRLDQCNDFVETCDLLMIHFGRLPDSPAFESAWKHSDLYGNSTEWIFKVSMLGIAIEHYWLRKPAFDSAVFNLQMAGHECVKDCRRLGVDPSPLLDYVRDVKDRSKLKGALDTTRLLEVVDDELKPRPTPARKDGRGRPKVTRYAEMAKEWEDEGGKEKYGGDKSRFIAECRNKYRVDGKKRSLDTFRKNFAIELEKLTAQKAST